METPEQMVEATKAAAKAISDSNIEIKSLLDQQNAEIKKFGRSTEETAKAIEKAEARLNQADTDLKSHTENFLTVTEKIQKRLDEFEKSTQRGRLGFDGGEQEKSLGVQFTDLLLKNRQVVEDALQRNNTVKGVPILESKTIWSPEAVGEKVLSTAETTNFAPTYQLPGIIPLQRRALRLRDMLNVVPTSNQFFRYIRELGFSPATGIAVSSITRSGQVATVTTSTAHGYRSRDMVQIAGATQTEYNGSHRITVLSSTTFSYVVTGSPATPATTSTSITALRLNNWGNPQGVAEGSAKPQAKWQAVELDGRVIVIAHWLPATRQVFDDVPGLRNLIDNRLIYGLRREEERQIIYGAGGTTELEGIATLAGTQSYNWSDGVAGDTMIDAFRRASTIVQMTELDDPTAATISPLDWETIELTKASTGQYILVNSPLPGTDPNSARIWRIPLVVTPAMEQGDVVMGPWASAAALYDRESITVRYSDQHAEYFTSNMVAILAEERVGMAWYRPESFVVLGLDEAPPEAEA